MAHGNAGRKQTPEHVAKRLVSRKATVKLKPQYVEGDRGYETPCWIWQLRCSETGYPLYTWTVNNKRTTRKMHRWYYEQTKGPIPEGLCIDHLCHQRDCVNPDHMEPVTHAENCRRRSRAKRERGGAVIEWGPHGRGVRVVLSAPAG